ncbi:MAG: HDIG domain-containing protein [Bdellovibrionales bacterium]|nr:HDIG domain-containing protein [Bdellovibrionales bacterium]
MEKRKGLFKKHTDEVHWRSKYTDPSRRFVEWCSSLGFEQTPIGRLVTALDERFHLRNWGLIFVFCLLLAFIIFWDVDVYHQVALGDVASTDIKSPISFQMTDEIATEEKKRAAEDSIPPVFDYDPKVYEQLINRVYRSFRPMRREIKGIRWPANRAQREQAVKDFIQFKPMFERELGVEIPDRLFEWLTENRFAAPYENILIRALVKWSSRRIMDGQTTLFRAPDSPLLVRVVSDVHTGVEEFTLRRDEVHDIKKLSDFDLNGVLGVENLSPRDKTAALDVAHLLVVPNLTFNRQESLDRRTRARNSVLPVQVSIKKGQTILTAGAVIQPLQVGLIHELNNLRSSKRTDFISVVVAFLFLILVTVFFSYLRRAVGHRLNVTIKDIYAMGSVVLLTVVLTKLYMFLTDSALAHKGSQIPANSLLFAAPIWTGPMLVGLMITSGEIVWLFTIFLSITLAMMVDTNFNFVYLLVAAIGGIAAARGVHSCTKRNDIYWAGVRTGLVNAAVLTAVTFLAPTQDKSLGTMLAWNVPLGFLGGVLSALVTMALIPLFESMFNYTTDVKLLELSSLNHPLMKDMIVKAPGTYHHSLVVGSMCEAAAEEIGANPLLAKVMAYYHDIGKMEHSQYFIENQRQGNNPHDHISPHMSKTVLIAHVKDGAEMGFSHKLGPAIIDGILQHHGTTLISYFYNKALSEQDEDIDMVHEEDFRYPGPKPQFKEAALLMLADSIEAAARSLDEPTPGRLTSLVRNIIQSKFLDGQLEECDLTLKDLSTIEESYRRVILGIYHQRIDYPTQPQTPARLPPALSQGPHLSPEGGRKKRKGAPAT